jgi:hypothetical protein
LDRRDLLGEDNPLWPLIERHEERTGLEAFYQLLAEDPNREQGPEKAVEMILFDLHVRRFTAERFQLDSGEMDFLFGRPLVIEAQALGFSFQESADGFPVLIRIPKGASETPDPGPDRP